MQAVAASPLGEVAEAEEAENPQRGGEPQLSAMDERLADTGELRTIVADPVFGGASDAGQLERWTTPWGQAEEVAPARRPYTPEPSGEDAQPPAFLRALDQLRRPMGPDDLLDGPPVFTRLAVVKEGGFVAEVNLGEVFEGSYVVAGESPYLRNLAAALLAAADALDAHDTEGAAAEEPAEAAPVLAEVPDLPAEPVTDDETTPVADDAEVTDGDLAAVSGQEGETQS